MAMKGNRNTKDLVVMVVVVIALVAFYGFLSLIVGLKNFVPLINGLAWPTVVVIALVAFRKPLSDFLSGIAQRAMKLSITSIFALEMPLPEASRPELDLVSILPTFASGDEAIESDEKKLITLLNKIGGDKALDYLIVDLERGNRWLTSRLFIFTIMLQRMRSLQCLVFLETRGDVDDRFLGTASANEVQLALAQRYPWLEEAYIKARIQKERLVSEKFKSVEARLRSSQGKLDPDEASELILAFLSQVQGMGGDKDSPPDPANKSTWEFLESRRGDAFIQYWEHANWIDSNRLKRILGDALQKSDSAWSEDSPDISPVKRVQAILRRKGPFVALVDKERVFKKLVDREALLEQVAERVGTASDGQLPTK